MYASNNHLTVATPSPAPSSCNTTSMLHNTQPIYNSSSTGGSSMQLNCLNSSYNYPSSTGFNHLPNKFGHLNGSPLLNQSLTNVTPLTSLTSTVNSVPTKRVYFGDTPQTINSRSNITNPHNPDSIQLLPTHANSAYTSAYPSFVQPVYNQDLNVTDVYYGTINHHSTLQTPMKLPRLNYMSNSRINLNSSLNNQLNGTHTNQSINNQPNSMYFPVVSFFFVFVNLIELI